MFLRLFAFFLLVSTTAVAQVPNRFSDEDSTATSPKKEEPQAKPTPARKAAPPSRKKGFDPDRLILGGAFGGSFSNVGSYILLQPMVGYAVSERFWAGLSGTYIYQSFTYPTSPNTTAKQEQSIYGGSVWGRFYAFGDFYLHGEVEALNGEFFDEEYYLQTNVYRLRRDWVPAVYLGAGYGGRMRDGGAFVSFHIMWNLIYDPYRSFYSNPILRIGVGF